jgi:trk system potassium uptake protein TrkA
MTWDKPLSESAPRSHHGVTIVGVKRGGEDFTYARPETEVQRYDQLIVSGPTKNVERFCRLQ